MQNAVNTIQYSLCRVASSSSFLPADMTDWGSNTNVAMQTICSAHHTNTPQHTNYVATCWELLLEST